MLRNSPNTLAWRNRGPHLKFDMVNMVEVNDKRPFATMGNMILVTPKLMCNHNIISRNERNGLTKISNPAKSLLSSYYRYIFRKWGHFQITKFSRVYMAGGQALPSSNFFPYKSSWYFWDLNCHQTLYFNELQTSNLAILLIFPALSIYSIRKVPCIKFKDG